MARYKPYPKKIRLAKVGRSNQTVPTWVIMKTSRRFTRHPKRRQWRSNKIKP
ncbi:MAG: 50S ribosomal protein L39e [Candidatus Heimdallarchaeota archaeon]|nr:50S ribosomal protein L39e [Candidatus Heimdallarchaeota archaeon]